MLGATEIVKYQEHRSKLDTAKKCAVSGIFLCIGQCKNRINVPQLLGSEK